MTNKEKNIILSQYQNMLMIHTIQEIDKSDSLREFRILFSALNLQKEQKERENIVICERDEIKGTKKEMYKMIFDSFSKYNIYINYDLSEIDYYFDELQYKMTDEEINCHKARIKYILES